MGLSVLQSFDVKRRSRTPSRSSCPSRSAVYPGGNMYRSDTFVLIIGPPGPILCAGYRYMWSIIYKSLLRIRIPMLHPSFSHPFLSMSSHNDTLWCWCPPLKHPKCNQVEPTPSNHKVPRRRNVSEVVYPAGVYGEKSGLHRERDGRAGLDRGLKDGANDTGLGGRSGGHRSDPDCQLSCP